jgi:branched-chain amino acid transport system substrate-binding protein
MLLHYRNNRKFTLVVLVCVMALLAAACSGAADETTTTTAASGDTQATTTTTGATPTTAADAEPIVIGGSLGLTGAFAGPSAGYKASYDYWLEQINANGGLLGRPVEMIIYDDESTPATAQSLYERLINQDNVDLLLAPYTTFVGGAIIPVAEAAEKVIWNGGFVGIGLFKASDWIVGAWSYQEPDYPRGVFEFIDTLPEDQRPTRVGIATAQNPFTIVVREGFEGYGGVLNFAAERGMEVVVDEQYPGDVTDVSGIIQKAIAEDVDLFFNLGLPNDSGLVARTAYDLGFKPSIYCACGSQVTALPYWPELGDAGENIMSTTTAWPVGGAPGSEELFQYLQDTVDYQQLPAHASTAYAVLQVLQQAVEGAGTLDQATLRDYVTGQSFDTVNGVLTYDEDRIPAYRQLLLQFIGGENRVIYPPDRAVGGPAVVPMP